MCANYELKTKYENLPDLLKKELPKCFKQNYAEQFSILPNDPVLVLKNEGKTVTSIMLWGFISEWRKDPFDNLRPRPFNARSESVGEKKLFRSSWEHKRCLLPASGFLEPNSSLHAIKHGISCSASSISLRPKSARFISATL